PLHEVVPVVRRAIGARLNPFLLQDVPHRLSANLFDTELAQLADNPSVAKPSRLGDLDDQRSDLTRLPLAALGILRLGFALRLVAHPTVERRWRDDRHQLFDRPANRFAELQ